MFPQIIPLIGTHSAPLVAESVNIHIGINRFRCKTLCLSQHGAVLRNDIVTAKHQILCRLSVSRRTVNVGADLFGAGTFHQHLPIDILPHRLVGSGKIHDHGSARQRMDHPRRLGRPDIFTDLTAHRQTAHRIHLKQDVRSERHLFVFIIERRRHSVSGCEMSGLIKFRIRRDIPLRNKSKHLSVLQNSRHIIEFVTFDKRQSHENQRIAPLRGPRHL